MDSAESTLDQADVALDRSWRSGTTLLLGIAALLLVILPNLIYDEPMAWPWREAEKPKPAQSETVTGSGGVTIGTKDYSFTIGRKKATTAAAVPASPPPPPPPPPVSPTKPYRIAAIVLAALGLAVAPFAWTRERHRPVALTGAVACVCALAWQYVLAGILIGVGIAVLLMLLSAFAG